MNEYAVTISDEAGQRTLTLVAATAAQARAQAEEVADVVTVRFLRAISFSCAIRDGAARR